MPEIVYSQLLNHIVDGSDLSLDQAREAFDQIMDGRWSDAQIAGFLIGLSSKGATAEEIAGAATAMREHAVPVDNCGFDVLDTCGTGGTGLRTFNVSTAVAMVAAGAGIKVAKHGNRTHTRASGSADALGALGVNLDAPPETAARCLKEAGVCFCFAIKLHPAMRFAAPVRKQLGVRTVFNLLGPLTNPARAKRQVMGIFDADLTETVAEVHRRLGTRRAMVVHAQDGLDELSVCSATKITELNDGAIETRTITPEQVGLKRAKVEELFVESPAESAKIIRGVLSGTPGPAREMVLLNAAAAMVVCDRAASLAEGIPLAAESIDSGKALEALEKLVECSRR
ncbi:MAG: anthranilate phosphoribosyltransferase [Phycisphaerae bacterium]